MRYQEATTVISAPLSLVEKRLAAVTSWPEFLDGLEAVEPLGHERYRFRLADGKDRVESIVCVRHAWADHRFTWRTLQGPPFTGRWELRAVDDGHTSVRLCHERRPGRLIAGLAEMVFPRTSRATDDLQNLERHLLTAGR